MHVIMIRLLTYLTFVIIVGFMPFKIACGVIILSSKRMITPAHDQCINPDLIKNRECIFIMQLIKLSRFVCRCFIGMCRLYFVTLEMHQLLLF